MTAELDDQRALITYHTGRCDLSSLVRCMEACGFDPSAYIANHEDFRLANMTPARALPHFLAFGWHENRAVVTSRFPTGLADLFQLPIENTAYKNRLLTAMFLGGVKASGVTGRVWAGDVGAIASSLPTVRARPFIAIGDSHVEHYARTAIRNADWLAPIVLTCMAGSASGLANTASRSQYGARLLTWARNIASSGRKPELPLLLKFGQVDVEFVWNFRRLRDGISRFSIPQFTAFAARSVRHYTNFLEQLKEITGPDTLRICSIFPPALSDAALAAGYINPHVGELEGDRALADLQSGIRTLEMPDLQTRTQLHAIYNGLLQEACQQLDLTFVDDFPLFLNSAGMIAEQYISESRGRDHHIDFNRTCDVMADWIGKLYSSP